MFWSHSQVATSAVVLIEGEAGVREDAAAEIILAAWAGNKTRGMENYAEELNIGQGTLLLKCPHKLFFLIVVWKQSENITQFPLNTLSLGTELGKILFTVAMLFWVLD